MVSMEALVVNGLGALVMSPPSVLDVCGYELTQDGRVRCTMPQSMTLMDIFRRANTECASLGRSPAVFDGDFRYWQNHTSAAANVESSGVVTGLVPNSANQTKTMQQELASAHGGIASGHGEMAALANVLHYTATGEDHFQGHWVRVAAHGVILFRDRCGLRVETYNGENQQGIGASSYHDQLKVSHIGCAASE